MKDLSRAAVVAAVAIDASSLFAQAQLRGAVGEEAPVARRTLVESCSFLDQFEGKEELLSILGLGDSSSPLLQLPGGSDGSDGDIIGLLTEQLTSSILSDEATNGNAVLLPTVSFIIIYSISH